MYTQNQCDIVEKELLIDCLREQLYQQGDNGKRYIEKMLNTLEQELKELYEKE